MTSIDTETVPGTDMRLAELIALGKSSVSVFIHGVDLQSLLDLMQNGTLMSIKREQRGPGGAYYFVAAAKVEDMEVTLFTSDLGESEVL